MNRRLFGAFGVLTIVALSAGSCKSDPLSDVDGNPAVVVTDFSYLQMPIGSTNSITASVLDARTNALAVPITFTACTADITVVPDPDYNPVPNTSARAIVTANTANGSCVRVAGGGIEDTVQVAVLPESFGGAFSSATPKGGDTLTISSTATLKFDPDSVTVTFGALAGDVVAATVDQVKVLVPFGATGAPEISGITVTYVPGLHVTLTASNTVTQTGDFWTGDDAYATAPTINLPAAGGTSLMITNFPATDNTAICGEASGPCGIYKYVVAGTDSVELTFTVDWDSDADVDTYSCSGPSAATCFEDGGAGATAVQPQAFTFSAAPGTHYFLIENFDHVPTANLRVTIERAP